MINSVELKISDFLAHKKSVERLNNELIHTYRQKETTIEEKESVLNFFIHSGQKRSAYRLILHDVKNEKMVLWGHLIDLVFDCKEPPDKEFRKAIHDGVINQNAETRAAKSRFAHLLKEELGWVRKSIRQRLQEEYQKAKDLMFQKLEFYRNEQLYQDEKRLLKELLFLYPKDPGLKSLQEDFDQRWARELITSKAGPKIEKPKLPAPSHEEVEFGQFLLAEARELCKQDTSRSYNFALMFYFMEQYDSAIQILRIGKRSFAANWFQTEILFEMKRYVECLNHLEELDRLYSDNPETAFATSYFKAQCYWELKQPGLAIQVMQSLLKIKPEYRSADSFMAKWTQGERPT